MPEDPALLDDAHGEIFLDARGPGRALRLTWHPEAELVVLSLWRDGTCAGTFRLSRADVGEFVDALVDGLRDAPGVHLPPRARRTSGRTGTDTGRRPRRAAAARRRRPVGESADGSAGDSDVPLTGFLDTVLAPEGSEHTASAR